MICSTSAVAVCCSIASASSRVRTSSFFCASFSSRVRKSSCLSRSAAEEPRRRAAVGALLRWGFVVLPRCVFAGLRVIVRRRLAEPSPWADNPTLPHHEVRCAAQQIGSRGVRDGSKTRMASDPPLCQLSPSADITAVSHIGVASVPGLIGRGRQPRQGLIYLTAREKILLASFWRARLFCWARSPRLHSPDLRPQGSAGAHAGEANWLRFVERD